MPGLETGGAFFMRFAIRDLAGLMVVGALSCMVAINVASSDPQGAMPAAVILFAFGGACYVGGVVVGRTGRISN